MKQRKKQQNDLSVLQSAVEDLKSVINQSPAQKEHISISLLELEKKAKEVDIKNKKLSSLIETLVVLLLLSSAFCFLMIDRNSVLQNKVDNMEFRDSLFHMIMGSDSSGVITYRVRDNKPLTYNQLASEHDSLRRSVNQYVYRDSLLSSIIGIKKDEGSIRYYTINDKTVTYEDFVKENFEFRDLVLLLERQVDSLRYIDEVSKKILWRKGGSINYLVRNGNPITYEELAAERDSLSEIISGLRSALSVSEQKIDLVTRELPIKIVTKDNYIYVESPQIDSALVLLPYYRDRIKLDSEKGVWIITTIK